MECYKCESIVLFSAKVAQTSLESAQIRSADFRPNNALTVDRFHPFSISFCSPSLPSPTGSPKPLVSFSVRMTRRITRGVCSQVLKPSPHGQIHDFFETADHTRHTLSRTTRSLFLCPAKGDEGSDLGSTNRGVDVFVSASRLPSMGCICNGPSMRRWSREMLI